MVLKMKPQCKRGYVDIINSPHSVNAVASHNKQKGSIRRRFDKGVNRWIETPLKKKRRNSNH